jgi:dTDP-4-amino-4,6-dideoxygalactose transaminase
MKLALLGGTPIRTSFPEPRPRLAPAETAPLTRALQGGDWSRAADDWPLPHLDLLEERWAAAHGAAHAVALSSGTAALTLVLRALRLLPGDEVLVPAYGCPAVDVAVLAAGLTPIHVEIDPDTYCLSPVAAAAVVTPRAAAMVAVHFAGQPAHVEALARVADRHGLALVEDACLAPGARFKDRPVGGWGRAAVFSLGVRKPVSAGEGGLVVTGDGALAEKLRRARNLGIDGETGEITEASGNYRLTALQASVALPQLARLDEDTRRREEAAARLSAAVEGSPAFRPLECHSQVTRHAWAQFWLRCDEEAGGVPRERVVEAVQAEGIPLFPGWPRPNYTLQVYTPARAAEWLRARGSGRDADHYGRTRLPHAERAAFQEALLLDFPLLDAGPEGIRDAAEALAKVSERLEDLLCLRG